MRILPPVQALVSQSTRKYARDVLTKLYEENIKALSGSDVGNECRKTVSRPIPEPSVFLPKFMPPPDTTAASQETERLLANVAGMTEEQVVAPIQKTHTVSPALCDVHDLPRRWKLSRATHTARTDTSTQTMSPLTENTGTQTMSPLTNASPSPRQTLVEDLNEDPLVMRQNTSIGLEADTAEQQHDGASHQPHREHRASSSAENGATESSEILAVLTRILSVFASIEAPSTAAKLQFPEPTSVLLVQVRHELGGRGGGSCRNLNHIPTDSLQKTP